MRYSYARVEFSSPWYQRAPAMDERRDGLQHPLVENRRHHRPVLIGDGQRLRRACVHAELALPRAGQRNVGLVAKHEVQAFRLAHESAIGLGLHNANRDDVASGLEHTGAHEIDARVLNPGAAAGFLPVDPNCVHALDDSQEHHGPARRKRIRQVDLFSEPRQRGRVGHAQFGEAARKSDRLPGGIVEVRCSPVSLEPNVVLIVPMLDVVAVFRRAFGGQAVN